MSQQTPSVVFFPHAHAGDMLQWIEPGIDINKEYALIIGKKVVRASTKVNAWDGEGNPLTLACSVKMPHVEMPSHSMFQLVELTDDLWQKQELDFSDLHHTSFAQVTAKSYWKPFEGWLQIFTNNRLTLRGFSAESSAEDSPLVSIRWSPIDEGIMLVDYIVRGNNSIDSHDSASAVIGCMGTSFPHGMDFALLDPVQDSLLEDCAAVISDLTVSDNRKAKAILREGALPSAVIRSGGEVVFRGVFYLTGDRDRALRYLRRQNFGTSFQWAKTDCASPAYDRVPKAMSQAAINARIQGDAAFMTAFEGGKPYPYKNGASHQGVYFPWGDKYQGMTGGDEIVQCYGYEYLQPAGFHAGAIAVNMLAHASVRARDAAAWFNKDGTQWDPSQETDDGKPKLISGYPMVNGQQKTEILPPGGTNAATMLGNGKPWEGYQRYDMQHGIRGMYHAQWLFWFTGDWVARETLREYGVRARAEWPTLRIFNTGTKGQGVPYGREIGHALTAVAYAASTYPRDPDGGKRRLCDEWIISMLGTMHESTTESGAVQAVTSGKIADNLGDPEWAAGQPYEHGIFLRGAGMAFATLNRDGYDVSWVLDMFAKWVLHYMHTAAKSGPNDAWQIGTHYLGTKDSAKAPRVGSACNDTQLGSLVFPLYMMMKWGIDPQIIFEIANRYIRGSATTAPEHLHSAMLSEGAFLADRRHHFLGALERVIEEKQNHKQEI